MLKSWLATRLQVSVWRLICLLEIRRLEIILPVRSCQHIAFLALTESLVTCLGLPNELVLGLGRHTLLVLMQPSSLLVEDQFLRLLTPLVYILITQVFGELLETMRLHRVRVASISLLEAGSERV